MAETVRVTYVLLVDGFILHPTGELIIGKDDWERMKQYNVATGGHFISVNASGGSELNARQILASKVRFTEFSADAPRSAFVNEDD